MIETAPDCTEDGFLGGRLCIRQPQKGFRAGSDAVLLAASVQADAGDTLLDVGCGVGTAALCAASRISFQEVAGIEFQENLVELAKANVTLNKGRVQELAPVRILKADITKKKDFDAYTGIGDRRFLETGFDHVISNPPFYEEGRAQCSPSNIKTKAHIEGEASLDVWIRFCAARVKPKGTLTLIHRSDRLPEILAKMNQLCGNLCVIPLWPNAKAAAKRVLIQGVKSANGPTQLHPGIVLHELDGTPTANAEKILRQGDSLFDILN
ncbi:MAG: methyltransferase [Sneathiellales bacterium]|nr:methyltransferase [Sneathiellales bacterium]